MIKCTECGKNNKDGSKFCIKCGSKLVNKTIFENKLNETENTFKSMGANTPAEIRNKFSNVNNKFISEGKIASVEEIMDRAGVKYEIIVKDRWYKILGNYDMYDNSKFNNSENIFTPKEIRIKYNSTNQMFISKGKIVSVEEIMNFEGVRYRIIEKNKLYQIFD